MKTITIDRNKRLRQEANLGHNRWHPDIPPIVEVDPGEEVVLETRDASDSQIVPTMTSADLGGLDAKVGHPLTGPVYVKGAEPGDLLEIEYLDIVAQPRGWTRNRPGAGFLRDVFTEPYLVHWNISDGWATSEQIPGVRIPDGSFMGTAGLAPSHTQLVAWAEREADWVRRGGQAAPPDPEDAVPAGGTIANEGLRTIPPRENCGNVDAKQLTKGSRLFVPVAVDGGLYSAGDGHFAQGDGEVASPRSRWAPPPRCVSSCTKARPQDITSRFQGSPIPTISCLRNGRRPATSSPRWVSRFGPMGLRKGKEACRWRPGTPCST